MLRNAWRSVRLGVLIFSLLPPTATAADQPATDTLLEARPDPDGGVRAHAVMTLPASAAAVEQLLTDYEHWPKLFETKMRMVKVERLEDRTITDLYVSHAILLSERHLVGENRVLPDGGLSTKMIGGDFTRYERTWKLSALDPTHTRAEFDLLVEVDTFVPDWLVAMEVKRELAAHFRILKATLQDQPGAH